MREVRPSRFEVFECVQTLDAHSTRSVRWALVRMPRVLFVFLFLFVFCFVLVWFGLSSRAVVFRSW